MVANSCANATKRRKRGDRGDGGHFQQRKVRSCGHRQPTHSGARGFGHEPIEIYTRSWTSRGSEATSVDKVDAFFGG